VAAFSRAKWPADGPVRLLLSYLDELHRDAGRPSLTEIGRAVALAPSTLSGFFTAARRISRGNLELIVEHLGGDVAHAETLRRAAAAEWDGRPAERRSRTGAALPGEPAARLEVVLFDSSVNTLNRPEHLIGRDHLAAELQRLLAERRRVLLHGMGGAGKTALAATVADRLADAGEPYLWLRPGLSDVEAAVDALVRALATSTERERITATTGDARLTALQEMIARLGVSCVVLDDIWEPLLAYTLLRALPAGVGAIVTSRLKLGIPDAIEVAELAPADALTLLTLHAGRAWVHEAEDLCADLGHHPYAIEIAGCHLRLYQLTPDELRMQVAPHELAMPGSFAAPGREGITRLLDRSYAALGVEPPDRDARAVLQAFGALHSGTATAELLAVYLGFDLVRTRQALHRLMDLSLVKRSEVYEVHDLTFSYARMLGGEPSIKAVTEFATIYSRDHRLLALDIDNLLGAAAEACQSDPSSFLAIIEAFAAGGYLDHQGHTLGLLRLLDAAIAVAEPPLRHTLLAKRANAHIHRGEFRRAADVYTLALQLAPNAHRRIVMLTQIGKSLAELGDHDGARTRLQEAHALAQQTGDNPGLLSVLEQMTFAAFRRKDYQGVLESARAGVELSRAVGDRVIEAVCLNNLGLAEFKLGVSAALRLQEQARDIAIELGSDWLLAMTSRTIAAGHHAFEDYDTAREHYERALQLYVSQGKKELELRLRKVMRQFGYLD
jgi:tetratricopeptide (TPR) repeat protein